MDAGGVMLLSDISITTWMVFVGLGNIFYSILLLCVFWFQAASAWYTWKGPVNKHTKCQLSPEAGHVEEAEPPGPSAQPKHSICLPESSSLGDLWQAWISKIFTG